MITWHYVDRAAYDAALKTETVTNDKLFFISDTGEIYRGKQLFNEAVTVYDPAKAPEKGAVGRLYINKDTLEGKIWNGTGWTIVIKAVAATLTATDTTTAVSGKAVADFVNGKVAGLGAVKDVTYTKETNSLSVVKGADTQTIALTGTAVDLVYNKKTGLLQAKNSAGEAIGTGINLDLERFVQAASYDAEKKKIILTFNDATTPLEVDVAALVDTYTASDTQTISMTVSGNKFAANAKLSTEKGNTLVAKPDGLYASGVDVSGLVEKVQPAVANNVAMLTAEGGMADSGYALGAAALNAQPSDKTLATEKAVDAIRASLASQLGNKMTKVGAGKAGEIIIASADGDAQASGKKVGGAAFADAPNENTVATEKGTVAYVAGYAVAKTNVVNSAAFAAQTVAGASDEKVTSEKAIIDALTWKTSV